MAAGTKRSLNTIKTYKRELEKYQEWLQEKGTGLHLLKKVDIQSLSLSFRKRRKEHLQRLIKRLVSFGLLPNI